MHLGFCSGDWWSRTAGPVPFATLVVGPKREVSGECRGRSFWSSLDPGPPKKKKKKNVVYERRGKFLDIEVLEFKKVGLKVPCI